MFNRLKGMIIAMLKVLSSKKQSVYPVCKYHVFQRNRSNGRPEMAILKVAVYKRKFGKESKNEEE